MKEHPHAGLLLYVMGPSGSGKDSLLKFAASTLATQQGRQRRISLIRRYITRPLNQKTEDHHPLDQGEFRSLLADGFFRMHWERHGLLYGIGPELDEMLGRGDLVLLNGSRSYLPEAQKLYPGLVPLLVTARPELLEQRLMRRGRENRREIDKRLADAGLAARAEADLLRLENSGRLEDAQSSFAAIIARLRAYGAE